MAIRTELNLRLPNTPGALAGVCLLLSTERVNILAMALEAGGQLRLVVDNHVHGGAVLREHHHQVTERDVILLALPRARRPGFCAPARQRCHRQRRIRLRRRCRRQPFSLGRARRGRRAARGRSGRRVTPPDPGRFRPRELAAL
jgi:hypothetical protein